MNKNNIRLLCLLAAGLEGEIDFSSRLRPVFLGVGVEPEPDLVALVGDAEGFLGVEDAEAAAEECFLVREATGVSAKVYI